MNTWRWDIVEYWDGFYPLFFNGYSEEVILEGERLPSAFMSLHEDKREAYLEKIYGNQLEDVMKAITGDI